jgi:hypothetical protein
MTSSHPQGFVPALNLIKLDIQVFLTYCVLQKKEILITSHIVTFLLLIVLAIANIQNTVPFEIWFLLRKLQMSITAPDFYSAVVGATAVAVPTLPAPASKHIKMRNNGTQS